MNEKLSAEALSALLGQFTPENLGSRLFMERSDLLTPENFLVWFHERFHYLQVEALAQQICGYPSRYCRDSFKLMCGFSYMGTNNCPHYLNGECDGYVDAAMTMADFILAVSERTVQN